ncbi:MAG TPA: MmcQ/YjbR family DNA-binding protein [Spirochaetota bacterium]|nr:MmcQ/YjbR family DNA-binding protein [Spirochaetota bacterium]
MDVPALRLYCLAKPATSADFPFGSDVLALRVGKKIFALVALDESPPRVNLKCDPLLAMELRERYPGVTPGYHMNKAHWNTVTLVGVPERELRAMIDHSYEIVLKGLSRRKRETIGAKRAD